MGLTLAILMVSRAFMIFMLTQLTCFRLVFFTSARKLRPDIQKLSSISISGLGDSIVSPVSSPETVLEEPPLHDLFESSTMEQGNN